MINLKLIEILRTFSTEELKNFEKFTKAVYFNKGRNYLPLLKTLKKFYPNFDNPKLTKSFLFETIFPGKKYNDQMLRNLVSGLQKICGQFLVFNKVKENEADYNLILSGELRSRMLTNLSEKYANKSLNALSKSGTDKDYFRKLYQLLQTKREISQSLNNPRETIESLSKEAVNFFYFFLLETNNQIEEMIVLNHNLNANFENHLTFKLIEYLDLDSIKNFLSQNNYDNSEIAELFIVHIKLLIDYKKEEYFQKFRELLSNNFDKLSRWGKYNIYLCLENACIRLQEIDEIKYRSILLDIYKEQLSLNVYNPDEKSPMAIDMFRNIVINALRLKQFEWVELFINKYFEKLSEYFRENMYNFSFSLLNFERKRFEESLNYLTKLKYDTFVFKFDVKVLSLMIYYELGYIEEAISMLDTFRHFISENSSISDYIKEIHFNFIKYLHEIIRLNDTNNKAEAQRLKSELQNSQVRNRDWLEEKLTPWF